MSVGTPILSKLAQLGAENFAELPSDDVLLGFNTATGKYEDRPFARLRDDSARALFEVDETASPVAGVAFMVTSPDEDSFQMLLRNDAFDSDPFGGFGIFLANIGDIVLEGGQSVGDAGRTFYRGMAAFGAGNNNGGDIIIVGGVGTGTGIKGDVIVGANAAEFVGIYGKAGVVQATKISDPAGGATVDAEARTAIDTLIDALEGIGITALV